MPDCKLMRPVFEVWAAYTEAVGELIGDRFKWLQWYELECDMGKRPRVAVFQDGRELKVKTLRHLAQFIADDDLPMEKVIANAEFLAIVHLYWPHVYQYVQRSYEAMQDALEHLYSERDSKEEDDPALDALIEKLENATGE